MRRLLFALVLFTFTVCSLASAENILQVDPQKYLNKESFVGYVPDRFIVVLSDQVAVNHGKDLQAGLALSEIAGFDDLALQYGVEKLRPQFPGSDRSMRAGAAELARHYKVYFNEGTLEEAMAAYEANDMVERVEPIGIHTLYATPNDTYYDDPPAEFPYDQWHYWDTYGIEADMAWDKETGDQAVIVGDLDIGCKWDHGDLGGSDPPGPDDAITNGNIWVNSGEVPGNSQDDDGNGYVDDVIGWDFVESTDWYSYPCIDLDCGGADNDPWDGDGHGTHTAGTIAAITNNGYCVAGVAGGFGDGTYAGGGNGVEIVNCRVGYVLDYWIYGATGVVIMDYVAEAMYYMADLKIAGWNVAAINCSFGTSNSGGLSSAADYLIAQDVIIVVAAGNSDSSTPDYLGSRGDCLDVGATDQSGNPADFSNYGSWVDIAAPGVQVMSTLTDPTDPTGDYIGYMDGTSMSCPHVVGVAALLESYAPSLSAADKIAIITDPANTKSYNMTKNVGVGIVDARKCIDAAVTCDLVADFSADLPTGCAPLSVQFTDASTGTNIDGWSWDFGDGVGTSIAQNPSYTYNNAGTYTVTLTVSSSSQGCSDDEVKVDFITVDPLPVADFSGSPTSGVEPLTVDFTDLSTDAISWEWDFGDGVGTSTAQNPSYTYNNAGTYTVTLTASNVCGSDVEQKVDYITVDPCVAPTADFSGTPTTGDAPLNVDSTDLSTGSPTSWDWDFGDGVGVSTAQNPSYTYNDPGTYTVTLTATNGCGSDAETKVDYITVTCTNPVADFVGTPTSGCAPLTVDFTDQSTGATSWSWDFGDGVGTSTAQNPSYTYNNSGCYTVTLTVTNACGSDQVVKVDYVCVDDCGPGRAYANADISVASTMSGDFTNTLASDNVYEGLTEIIYDNHPRKRSSYLEHKWTVDVGDGGSSMTFYVEGYRPSNAENDDFIFAYSTDDATYVDMVTVASGTEQVYSYAMPTGLTGTIYIRVVDTDRSWENTAFDDVFVDEMYIEYESTPGPPVAEFAGSPTTGYVPLTVDFTDLSTGNPDTWSWTFGDGGTSTAQNPSYTYNTAGTYTVTLDVSNAYGSDVETKVDYITVMEEGNFYSHVSNMVVGRRRTGANERGTCTVTIFDQANAPLADATVYVSYDGPNSGNLSGVTASDGTVYFETEVFKKPTGEWCFEVTNVTHATHTYDPASNDVTRACESGWVYGDDRGMHAADVMRPDRHVLYQNNPNPFNPATDISFDLKNDCHARLDVYNLLGQRMTTLVDDYLPAGEYTFKWNANGEPSGVYFYRLTTDSFVETRKMVLMK